MVFDAWCKQSEWLPLTEIMSFKKNHNSLLNVLLFVSRLWNLLGAENKLFKFKIFILLPCGLCCPGWPYHLPTLGYVPATVQWILIVRWQVFVSAALHLLTSVLFMYVSASNTTQPNNIPYILESNPHPFYSFRGLKNQMQIRIACGLDSRSWAGFWKNDRAAVRAVRTIQYNNLLFNLLFITLYNIYNLLFIRLAVITHNWIIIRHPVTIIFIFTIALP